MGERNNKTMKRLDHYIGCPLLFILGAFRKKNSLTQVSQSAAPKIVILKTAGMGDTIVTNAAIQEIKANFPKAKITYICSKTNFGMSKALPDVDELFCFQMKRPIGSLLKVKALGHFDYLFDFAPWARINAVISFFIDADFKVGFKRKGMHRHYIYDKPVEHLDAVHEVENYRNCLRAAGLKTHDLNPIFDVTDSPIIKEPYVVFHIFPAGSSVLLRKWSNENWLKLAKKVYRDYGYKVLFSGGKEDITEADSLVKILKEKQVNSENIAGKYDLNEMENVLKYAQFLVSVNTGIMHMGAAVGVPLIALHGATSVKRWGPLSEKAYNIWTHEPCQPCISLGFESKCTNPVCMKHITVEMVMHYVNLIEREKKYGNSKAD